MKRALKPLREKCYIYAIVFSTIAIGAYIAETVVGKNKTNHFTSIFFVSIASIIWILFFTAIGIKTICKHRGKKVLGIVEKRHKTLFFYLEKNFRNIPKLCLTFRNTWYIL